MNDGRSAVVNRRDVFQTRVAPANDAGMKTPSTDEDKSLVAGLGEPRVGKGSGFCGYSIHFMTGSPVKSSRQALPGEFARANTARGHVRAPYPKSLGLADATRFRASPPRARRRVSLGTDLGIIKLNAFLATCCDARKMILALRSAESTRVATVDSGLCIEDKICVWCFYRYTIA